MLCVLGLEIVHLYVFMMEAMTWDSDDLWDVCNRDNGLKYLRLGSKRESKDKRLLEYLELI